MRAYYEDFTVLMQRLGEWGGAALVHVEPDLWGYMQHPDAGHSDDASKVPAAGASSGQADVKGLSDNAAGFAQALARLRNKYAPEVKLAYHVSIWGTGTDINAQNVDDVAPLAQRSAAFYRSLGVDFELIAFDPSDRDAGYYEVARGDGGAHWWDDADFTRFRDYVKEVVKGTNRRALLWQVPLGNRVMRACDNPDGHYQDNRVEYFLGPDSRAHLTAWAQVGLVGILYGGGSGETPSNTDAQNDGVNNPAPINGNSGPANVSDDDGGYFRERGRAYYRGVDFRYRRRYTVRISRCPIPASPSSLARRGMSSCAHAVE